MPTLDTDSQLQVIAALTSKGVSDTCPSCSYADRTVSEKVGFLSTGDAEAIPLAMLLCERCGHVALYALHGLGLKFGGVDGG